MMLSDVSVRRPVLALMMSAALIVLGLFSYKDLGLDLMPKTEVPIVTVSVALPGASAEEIESQLTKRIEEAVNTITGVDELTSTSTEGSSRVTINFTLERDIEAAVQDVRDKLATIVNKFPDGTKPPVIQKVDPDATSVFSFSLLGPRDIREITDIADKKFKRVLETVPGVGLITFAGAKNREIQLLLNADRLRAYGLSADQVRAAVVRQNVEIPGGSFVTGPAQIDLRTMGRIRDVKDFNRIVISYRADGSAVTFADVGRVEDGVEDTQSGFRSNGQTSVSLSIVKQSGANTVDVVNRVKARIKAIQATLPQDLQIAIGNDQSVFIQRSFEDIKLHLVLGSLFAALIVFFFIRNLRVTFIAALAIPTSIIGTFTVMKALGFTLNNMTMLALSLATGIVIDDAIVVLENIFRFVEEKHITPKAAAAEATREIAGAVMATTLSLIVIFVPVAFMTGQVGRYFYSFGITAASAILISMFVSFTLTPALCAWWMTTADTKADHSTTKSSGFYARLDREYGRMLSWSLAHRVAMIGIALLVSLSAALLYPYIGKELVPDDDQGDFNVSIRLPRGTSYARTEEFNAPIEKELLALPDYRRLTASVSAGNVSTHVLMTGLEERKTTQQDMMRRIRGMLRKYRGVRTSVSGSTDISGASSRNGGSGGSNRLAVLIQGPDIDQLQEYTVALMDKIRTINGVVDVDSTFEPTQPELRVNVDRARAADLGVSIDSLASGLRTLVGGDEVSEFQEGDDNFIVRLRLDEAYRNNPLTMGELLVPGAPGKTVKVSDVATLTQGNGPAQINRYNRERQISVIANIDRVPLGEVIAAARIKVDELRLKPGYQAVFGGSAKDLAEASNNFVVAIVLAVAFIYMVLAGQFNSFVHPLTIMTALPLSLPAGLLALKAFGMTLNIYSAIGLMMLFGVVKKNSILQVDYTNTLRAQGLPQREAVITASHVRLRPILMTTLAIIAGMLPIAFGRGYGAGSRASMAVTIIGGQVLCLLLTLLVAPVVYTWFDDLRAWSSSAVARKFSRKDHVDRPAEG